LGAEMHCRVWWAKLRERSHIEKDGVDGRIIIKRVFPNQGARSGLIRILDQGARSGLIRIWTRGRRVV